MPRNSTAYFFVFITLLMGVLCIPSYAHANFELVSHWTLDESSGTRADSQGDNDLTSVNNTPMVSGQVDNAASFPAENSTYLTINDNASLSTTGTTTFKISLWVKLLSKSSTQVFVSKYANGGQGEYALYYENAFERFVFSTYAGGSGNHYVLADALGEPEVDTWYYLEAVHDGTNNRNTITVNQTYTNTIIGVPAHQDTTAPFRIGAFGPTPAYFANAVIDEVKFYKAPASPVAQDLVAHWKFDEGSGTTAVDASGNKHHGIIINTPYSDTVPDVNFDNSHSLYFNPANSGRIVTTNLSLNNYTGFTLTGWAYPTAATSRASWFGQNDVFEFGFSDGNTLFCYTSRGQVSWEFDPGEFLNNWHYISCLGTEDELIVYVDGQNVGSADTSGGGSYGSSGDTFSIGAGAVDGDDTGPFSGYIDDVRVYSRGLSPQEMESLAEGAEAPESFPVIVSVSPLNALTQVATTTDLVIEFDKSVVVGTGNVGVYLWANGSPVQDVDVTSGDVTGSGTDTITINLPTNLNPGIQYYVLIDATAFDDTQGNSFAGISDPTTWGFTTEAAPVDLAVIVTGDATDITRTVAYLNATVVSTGGQPLVPYGFYVNYEPSAPGEYEDIFSIVSASQDVGSFDLGGEAFECGTTYYYRAFGTNDAGTAYGEEESFSTLACEDSDEPVVEVLKRQRRSGVSLGQRLVTQNVQVMTPKLPVRDLTVGSTGDDVRALQQFLNMNGYPLATTGPGSPGNETTIFGALTRAALATFQSAQGISPSVGYFGPLTRGKIQSLGLSGIWW